MKAILGCNNLGFIGLNGQLPFRCKADLQHFKQMTLNKTCLVGHNTLQKLPPLKNRKIVTVDDFNSLEDILENVDFCIGGKKTYEKFCPFFTELHISHINNDTIGDTILPDLSKLNPNCKIYNYYFQEDIL